MINNGSRSLAFRLIAGAALWCVSGLAVGGLVLSSLFLEYVERSFDDRLTVLLESLVTGSEIAAEGRVDMTAALSEARFEQPYSGWYWQISQRRTDAGAPEPVLLEPLRSRSLWDWTLPGPDPKAGADLRTANVPGPDGQSLRLVAREIILAGADFPLDFVVAGDRSEMVADIRRFNSTLAWSLGLLGGGLVLAMFFQVRFGLKPLRRIQVALADIRSGRDDQLTGPFPSEIQPLAAEVNALLEHNTAVVERARTHVGNLAHALKTPLSVLLNESAASTEPLADTVSQQTILMQRHVDHYLVRARTAASGGVLGVRTEVAEVLEDLRRTLLRIHARRDISIEVECEDDLLFRGERQDLEEMTGNLMDNACKWAREQVNVSVSLRDGEFCILVDDDGPGLPPARREEVIQRGKRLDESVPGSGLGLSIVADIAGLYDGKLALQESPTQGLRAALTLPGARRTD
ncbi:sensor histidine kinase [Denitrobaculum tricleocarpae]|uniref:histidine kinase n=1 Tax=Denitrobaculum tricleocarpae TaxID=2591009 RepID=A0A545TMG8_9PROT|nr:sensor histidine kinase [Denitrobaculum tricleocarpae]TQV78386.1 sensor histidine kinase [Denitrobaculum tricleocarpae]